MKRFTIHDSRTGERFPVVAATPYEALKLAAAIVGRPLGCGRWRDLTATDEHGIY